MLVNWDGDDDAGFEIQERKFGQGCMSRVEDTYNSSDDENHDGSCSDDEEFSSTLSEINSFMLYT